MAVSKLVDARTGLLKRRVGSMSVDAVGACVHISKWVIRLHSFSNELGGATNAIDLNLFSAERTEHMDPRSASRTPVSAGGSRRRVNIAARRGLHLRSQ